MAAYWIFALARYAPIACSAQNSGPPPGASALQAAQSASPSTPAQAQPGTSQLLPQQPPSAESGPASAAQSEIDEKLQAFVCPAKGQSATQQSEDEQQCFEWARSSAANQAPPKYCPRQFDTAEVRSTSSRRFRKRRGRRRCDRAIASGAGEGAAIGATKQQAADALRRPPTALAWNLLAWNLLAWNLLAWNLKDSW
jgi:hypothetical protein